MWAELGLSVLAAAEAAEGSGGSVGSGGPAPGEMHPLLRYVLTASVYVLCAGMAMCLFRLTVGPELADRVLAADLLSLHVVGLTVVLTIYIGDLVFFDAALVVAIIGFVSTVGFSQYIFATAQRTGDDGRSLDPAAGPGGSEGRIG
ncbi:MAG: monovalent cation/H+ antiporter complex subunit F [Planctomycetota bacterium]